MGSGSTWRLGDLSWAGWEAPRELEMAPAKSGDLVVGLELQLPGLCRLRLPLVVLSVSRQRQRIRCAEGRALCVRTFLGHLDRLSIGRMGDGSSSRGVWRDERARGRRYVGDDSRWVRHPGGRHGRFGNRCRGESLTRGWLPVLLCWRLLGIDDGLFEDPRGTLIRPYEHWRQSWRGRFPKSHALDRGTVGLASFTSDSRRYSVDRRGSLAEDRSRERRPRPTGQVVTLVGHGPRRSCGIAIALAGTHSLPLAARSAPLLDSL